MKAFQKEGKADMKGGTQRNKKAFKKGPITLQIWQSQFLAICQRQVPDSNAVPYAVSQLRFPTHSTMERRRNSHCCARKLDKGTVQAIA